MAVRLTPGPAGFGSLERPHSVAVPRGTPDRQREGSEREADGGAGVATGMGALIGLASEEQQNQDGE